MTAPHLGFALRLHERLPAGDDLVWSPYSAASALGLAAAGARGPTRDELVAVLAPGGDLAGLGRLLAGSARLADAEIAVANTLWTRLGLDFHPAYRDEVLGWPGGGVRAADFRTDPEGSRRRINADVAATTRDLIQDLLPPGRIRPDTAAVVVNALYLRIAWRQPFPERGTRPAVFHAPAGDRPVPTMRQRQRLGYAEAHGWRMATLPTASEVVVDVLLPAAEPRLDAGVLADLHRATRPAMLDLALPRFRVQAAAELTEPLAGLGVRRAFGADADFSGITSDAPLSISSVAHKAVLRVDEHGFEGAAATATAMVLAAVLREDVVPFHVDRPFLVVVRHPGSGAVYFLARVSEP